jgi:hypothetical protein
MLVFELFIFFVGIVYLSFFIRRHKLVNKMFRFAVISRIKVQHYYGWRLQIFVFTLVTLLFFKSFHAYKHRITITIIIISSTAPGGLWLPYRHRINTEMQSNLIYPSSKRHMNEKLNYFSRLYDQVFETYIEQLTDVQCRSQWVAQHISCLYAGSVHILLARRV